MSEPRGEFLRHADVLNWLEEDYNIPRTEARKLIETKTITGKPLRPGGRNFYRKTQVKEVLNGSGQQQTPNAERPTSNPSNQTNQESKKKGKGHK
jgi:hypothetical protein